MMEILGMAATVACLAIGAGIASKWLASEQPNRRLRERGVHATEIGMHMTRDGELYGEFGGLKVGVRSGEFGEGPTIVVTVPASVAAFGFKFADGKFDGHERYAEVSEIGGAIRICIGLGCDDFDLVHGVCFARFPSSNVVDLTEREIDAVCQVAMMIAQQWRAEWATWASGRGLTVREEGRLVEGGLNGVQISIREIDGSLDGSSLLSAELLTPFADPTLISEPAVGELGVELNDLILHNKLKIDTPDLGALATRIKTDAARGPLLDFVLRSDGVVFGDRVQLIVEGRPSSEDLDRRFGQLVELVLALK
jgi:hypothetical protein